MRYWRSSIWPNLRLQPMTTLLAWLQRPLSWLQSLTIALALIGMVTPVTAADLNWARRTHLPAPTSTDLPPPPATQSRANGSTENAANRCSKGNICIVCVANCDDTPPVVVSEHKLVRTHTIAAKTHAENNSDGVSTNAPLYARPAWAGIVCGERNGCVASGLSAPPRPYEVDIRISVINRYID